MTGPRIYNKKDDEQKAVLSAFYAHTPYPTTEQVEQLSHETGLGFFVVKKWFNYTRKNGKVRASWVQWEVGTALVWLAIWAVGIACMPKVVPRDEMLWPMAHTRHSTAVVVAFFLLSGVFAWFIAATWSRCGSVRVRSLPCCILI